MEKDILKTNGISGGFMVYKFTNSSKDSNIDKEIYRFGNGCFLICLKGNLTLSVNLTKYVVCENSLITIFPHTIVQFNDVSSDFEGYAIFFTPEFANNIYFQRSSISFFAEINADPLLIIRKEEMNLFIDFCQFLSRVESYSFTQQYKEINLHLLRAFLYALGAAYRTRIKEEKKQEKPSRATIIFRNFIKELSEHYQSERSVTFYADKLCITPKYLSSICKEVSGKLAMHIIANAVILEAKSKLHDFSLTVQEVSDQLNFPNASFFGRYFKRHTGFSPMQYRSTLT